jgi:hypothetical protein
MIGCNYDASNASKPARNYVRGDFPCQKHDPRVLDGADVRDLREIDPSAPQNAVLTGSIAGCYPWRSRRVENARDGGVGTRLMDYVTSDAELSVVILQKSIGASAVP